MKEKKYEILIYFIYLVVIILFISTIINIFILNRKQEINLSEKINCSSKDIFNMSYCMRDELSEFYNYNISNIKRNLNISELKEQGGVCWHYANYYKDNFLKLGAEEIEQRKSIYKEKTTSKYYISKFIFAVDNETSHAISIVSNSDGYCILDQLDVRCFRFKN